MKPIDHSQKTKHTKGLPKFRDVLKSKGGIVPILQGPALYMELNWHQNEQMKKEQVFTMKIKGNEYYVSKQALEHFLRAI